MKPRKLTPEQAEYLKSEYQLGLECSVKRIAARYGIHRTTVREYAMGKHEKRAHV